MRDMEPDMVSMEDIKIKSMEDAIQKRQLPAIPHDNPTPLAPPPPVLPPGTPPPPAAAKRVRENIYDIIRYPI